MTAPLDGILVADFSRVLAGPMAAMTLADLGATVVKVERPGVGDESRAWGPPWTPSSSAYFEGANRSKYSVTLDLAEPHDRARAVELASRADVIVENYRPGSLARFGLDYPSVSVRNPAAVYCSITGFGGSAGSDRPGYDFLVQAVGGLMSITGDADGEPTKVGVAVVDVLTGKDAVIGILAALTARAQTGRGQHVQVELLSSLLGGLVNQAAGYLTTGVAPGRMGNRHPSVVPYQTLRCADGPLAVACGNDGQFARLVGVLELPALASDTRFTHNGDRVEHRDELIPLLEARTIAFSAAALEARLTQAGVPAGLVGDIGDGIARAQDCGLSPLVELGDGEVSQIRHPVRYSSSAVGAAVRPPGVGEHDDVVHAWLDGPSSTVLPRVVSEPRGGGTAR